MGTYNVLNTIIKCKRCKYLLNVKVQFKFGDTWLYEYQLGDKINWGGNDKGEPNLAKVKAYGILSSGKCPNCGFTNEEEYDIFIENDSIRSIAPLSNISDYNADEEGNYYVYDQ